MVTLRLALRVALVITAGLSAAGASLAPAQDGEGPPAATAADPESVSEVREAFSGQAFPWYDPPADDFRPVLPPRPPRPSGGGGGGAWFSLGSFSGQDLGRLIVFVLLAALLTGVILYVARTWQRRLEAEEREHPSSRPAMVAGSAARVDTLPTGLEIDESDPLAAARSLREQGDRARAVILLFAHQLLTLDRLGQIRLAPGRTGRQLVRSIGDESIRGPVSRTLRLFEDVYYGHRDPDPDAFELLWAEAEALDASLGAGVAP